MSNADRAYTPQTIRYGGSLVSGVGIACFECKAVATHARGQQRGYGADLRNEARRHTAYFERLGWKVGLRPQDDRCPKCASKPKPFIKFDPYKLLEENKPMTTKIAEALKDHLDAPKPMSQADGRLIFAKLEEVYADEATGYTPGWTDQKVATDMGVPRAWVENVRKQFFGPEGDNPDIRKQVSDAKAILAEAKALFERYSENKEALKQMIAAAQALTARCEMIERRLCDIAKGLGR